MTFDVDQRVVVLESNRTRIAGVAGCHGQVTEVKPQGDSGGSAYGVKLDGRDRVHLCHPDDLAPEKTDGSG